MSYTSNFNGLNDTHFDPSIYPRTYKLSTKWLITCLILAVGGLVGIGFCAITQNQLNMVIEILLLCFSAIFLLFGLSAFRSKLILTADEIILQGIFKARKLRRIEIAGYRIRLVNGTKIFEFKSNNPTEKDFKLEMTFKEDDAFRAWLSGITNIDQNEYMEYIKVIEQDVTLGSTPEERLEKIRHAKQFAKVFIWVLYLVIAWTLLYPRPYVLAISSIAVIPWITIALCRKFGNLFSIDDPGKNSARADLTVAFLSPGFMLTLRALQDVNLNDWTFLIIPSIVGSILFMSVAAWAAPEYKKIRKFVTYSVLVIVYPASIFTITNTLLDHGQPDLNHVTILGKRITTGKGASQYFSVTPWEVKKDFSESKAGSLEVHVSKSMYGAYNIGDKICIRQYQGAFNMPWFLVAEVNCRI